MFVDKILDEIAGRRDPAYREAKKAEKQAKKAEKAALKEMERKSKAKTRV